MKFLSKYQNKFERQLVQFENRSQRREIPDKCNYTCHVSYRMVHCGDSLVVGSILSSSLCKLGSSYTSRLDHTIRITILSRRRNENTRTNMRCFLSCFNLNSWDSKNLWNNFYVFFVYFPIGSHNS